MGVAPIIAPLIGGYLALFFGWRSIFGVLAVVSAVCLVAVYKFLPETRAPNQNVRLGKTFGIYFNTLADQSFLGFALAGGLAQAGMFAFITGSPFIFIKLFGIRAESYGWIFGSNALGMVALSQINSQLVRSVNPTKILGICLTATAFVSFLLILAGIFNLGFWVVAVLIFLYVASLGMILPNTTAGALAAQTENAGAASALIGTFQYGLAALASSLVSYFNNGTSLPMISLIGTCGIVAFLVYKLLIEAQKKQEFTVSAGHTTFG